MKTVKYRLDFSAHASIVVEVPDTENSEEKANACIYSSYGCCILILLLNLL